MVHSFSLNDSTQLQLRRALRDCLPPIPSGHLTEAVAAGLGFRSHADLKALSKSTLLHQRRYAYFDWGQFSLYLWKHGYDITSVDRHGPSAFVAPTHGSPPYALRPTPTARRDRNGVRGGL